MIGQVGIREYMLIDEIRDRFATNPAPVKTIIRSVDRYTRPRQYDRDPEKVGDFENTSKY